jgi:hypothetical protein
MNERQSNPDVDETLRRYFRAQLPHPWPAARVPATDEAASLWRRSRLRLALAASAAAVLAGYLTLAGFWRQPVTSHAIDPNGPHIADRPSHHA